MKIDVRLSNVLGEVPASVRRAQELGADGVWTGETNHDPFLPMAVAAGHNTGLELGIAAAVAFARSPMTTAYLTDDLFRACGGRFLLGLGAQVATHVTQRFSMPYSQPVDRMREYIAALRAIWSSWRTGDPLDFRGDFYQHTLMTPMFSPGASPLPSPAVYLASVGPRMATLAGEVADGLLVHAFSTPRYLREVTLPALRTGLARAGRPAVDVPVVVPVFVVTAATEESFAATRRAICQQISFYASTPAYAPVLETHGLAALHWELFELSLAGDWGRMADLIDDDVLEVFAVVGEPATIATRLKARLGDHVGRVVLSPPTASDAPWPAILAELRRLVGVEPAAQV